MGLVLGSWRLLVVITTMAPDANRGTHPRSRNTAAVISLFRLFVSIAWDASLQVKTFHQHKYCDSQKVSDQIASGR
jgi:hypothetical protein